MKRFKLVNNVTGWLVFLIAAVTYCMTVEPSAPFWDCPEFTTTAARLEVGHPPGAPFFMLMGNFFSHFAADDTQVALMVNVMSALMSALCILFLFWSVTHLVRKLIIEDGAEICTTKLITIMASGAAAALAYAWSDTFWFSAVESEVYSSSSMFTALVFWLILKWEDNADEPRADRWLVLIFYLTGLSIGVHLLNLLCLPAIVLVYYYKRYPDANLKGSLFALTVSVVLVAAVLYGVVPGIVKVGGWFELFCVNTLGMPFNTGMILYLMVLVGTVLSAIWATTQKNRTLINVLFVASVGLLGIPFYGKGYAMPITIGVAVLAVLAFALTRKGKDGEYIFRKQVLNTSLLCMLMLMIGYSSYAVIVIRSTQNTPMDQNSPEDIFTLGTYLNREQYGDRPLFYGEAYTSQATDYAKGEKIQRHENNAEERAAGKGDAYDVIEVNDGVVYPSSMKMLFPRMYSSDPRHVQAYEDWLGEVTMNPTEIEFEGNYYPAEMPSQWDNIRFFFSYQVNFMYWRYFLWNFAGRQNDIQGHGEPYHGNWITGFSFIDDALYGNQKLMPDELSKDNKGHNVFYCLPLLLGILGLFWQAYRGKRGIQQFWVVFFLFFMTGLAIVLYLNQTPLQPRERDYAYAGSFYAFAMWIGFGVAAIAELPAQIAEWAKKNWNERYNLYAACAAAVIALAVPLQMVSQTWDDHDRSGRTACRDFGGNYLSTLPEEGAPIIFTNGDNDTFPLWYNQDTEGLRTDARVCNLSYLQTDWYTDQMCRPAWKSPALPITWERSEYVDNQGHDVFYVRPNRDLLDALKIQLANDPAMRKQFKGGTDPYELQFIIDNFVRNSKYGYIPTDSIVLSVDKKAVIASGMMLPYGQDSIPEKMHIDLSKKQRLLKSEIMVYEMLAHHNWTRPMYMSTTLGMENYAGLEDYLVLEGLAYRVTPFKLGFGTVDSEKMYKNMMTKFRYGGLEHNGLYLDETNMRMCFTHRSMFVYLVGTLLAESDFASAEGRTAEAKDKKAKALKALEYCKKVIPAKNVPYDPISVGMDSRGYIFKLPHYWHEVGRDAEAERILLAMANSAFQYLRYFSSLPTHRIAQNIEECYRQWTYLEMVYRGLSECKSKQLSSFEERLMSAYKSPAGALVQEYLKRASGGNYESEEDQFPEADSDLIDVAAGDEAMYAPETFGME